MFGNPLVTYNRTTEDEIFVAPVNGRNFVKYINSRTDFLHVNALGSTGLITDNAGNLTQDELYYPWGQVWQNPDETDDVRFGSMQERDAVTGFDPTPARDYNNNIGRWMTPDPLAGDISNPQSLNRYAYVLNNPTTLTDPLGLNPFSEDPGGVQCRDATFAESHAQCQGPGSPWCFVFPTDAGCIYTPPISGGGGGGGSIGGNSQNTGGPVRPFPAGGLPTSPCTINGDPVSCPQSPLWVLILAAPPPFLIAITSTGQVPHTPGSGVLGSVGGFLGGIASTTYNSTISPNGCINQFFWNTLGNLNPFTPSTSSLAEPAANFVSAVKFNSALAYAASRPNYLGGTGLLYPFKSGVFRGLISSAQGVLEATPAIQLDLALGQALFSEYRAAKAGECQ